MDKEIFKVLANALIEDYKRGNNLCNTLEPFGIFVEVNSPLVGEIEKLLNETCDDFCVESLYQLADGETISYKDENDEWHEVTNLDEFADMYFKE